MVEASALAVSAACHGLAHALRFDVAAVAL
jgi:hypothetical protein